MRRLTLTLAAAALLVSACTLAPGEEVKPEAIETTTSTSLPEVTTTTAAPVVTTTTAVCHEDMPCWDCETMGNGICGEATSCAEASA
jgi:PBP1b-binding outer membrane lipoprotein LpoB